MAQQKDEKIEALNSLMTGDPRAFCAKWLQAIEQAGVAEETWRDTQAEQACKAYEGDASSGSTAFNIYHSNIETMVPALYNSTPIPDVRRRFNDDDPVASQVSTILERALSFCVDDYDFNDVMKRIVKDMAVVDRGIARVKYEPTIDGEGEEADVVYEEAISEHVQWRDFRRGPATTWAKVPWVAFRHGMSREEIAATVAKGKWPETVKQAILDGVQLNKSAEDNGEAGKSEGREVPTFGARSTVWEVWDKDTRSVVFLSEDYGDYPLAVLPDPLKLRSFFPTPRPAMIIESTTSLTPITAYSIYATLIDELNQISERIKALVKQIRVRGAYAGIIPEIKEISEQADGELLPLANSEMFATTGGGLEKAIIWFPIEPVVMAVKELVQQREMVKQVIYEVTGLSDIVRGASNAAETATAQQIKQQWGSVRIQAHQKEVERYAADLFRLKAEIFCKHFDVQTLLLITGLKYPTQAEKERAQQTMQRGMAMYQKAGQMKQALQAGQVPPEQAQAMQEQLQQLEAQMPEIEKAKKEIEDILSKPSLEEIEAMMRDERVLKYRVDVESDSTVRSDLTKNQEQLKGFLEGTAQYAQAIGPMVQQGAMDGSVAVEIFAAFARNFRLGKQAEDALDGWADKIKKNGMQGKEDPVAQADAKLKMSQAQKTDAEAAKVQTETKLMPLQFQAETAEKRARVKMDARKAHSDTQGAMFDRSENAKANRAKHGLEVGRARQADRQHSDTMRAGSAQLQQADRHHGDQINEAKAGRQQSGKLERLKMADGIKARREGHVMSAHEKERPLPPELMQQAEGEPVGMTDEENEQAARTDELLQSVVSGMEGLVQSQAQSTAQMAGAIENLAKIMSAPKKLVRDEKGKPIGVELA